MSVHLIVITIANTIVPTLRLPIIVPARTDISWEQMDTRAMVAQLLSVDCKEENKVLLMPFFI